jgi:hypothetical protein
VLIEYSGLTLLYLYGGSVLLVLKYQSPKCRYYARITHHIFDDIDIMTYNINIPKI